VNKNKPILFSTPMVQAILAGRKTMTRRVVKHQPPPGNSFVHGWVMSSTEPKNEGCVGWGSNEGCVTHFCKPLCQVGDILWVRETWQRYVKGDELEYCYLADMKQANLVYTDLDDEPIKWKPSIFMPRSAARLFLKVRSIRVERLQDIKYFDCLAEGLPYKQFEKDIITDFQNLWDNLNAKRGYGWDLNPWVWVVEFERIKTQVGGGVQNIH